MSDSQELQDLKQKSNQKKLTKAQIKRIEKQKQQAQIDQEEKELLTHYQSKLANYYLD